MGIYYHLTSVDNLEAVLRDGLLQEKARSLSVACLAGNLPSGNPVFFAKKKRDAIWLAPLGTRYLARKKQFAGMKKSPRNKYVCWKRVSEKVALLHCDLSGLEEDLYKDQVCYKGYFYRYLATSTRKDNAMFNQYLLYRNLEPERIVNYEILNLKRWGYEEKAGMKELLEEEDLLKYKIIYNTMNSPAGQELLNAYDSLNREILYKSNIHGIGHIERVMLFGAILADKRHFDIKDTRLLLLACSYHDIGRRNDQRDETHGERGAELIKDYASELQLSDEDLAILQAAIAVHSTEDMTLSTWLKRYSVQDKDRATRISLALKDADILDRVRLQGVFNKDYLHSNESKHLICMAETVLNYSLANIGYKS